MEFSKEIVKWATWFTTLVTVLVTIGYYITGKMPTEVVTLTGSVTTGVIVAYCAKAGAENVQKIKKGESQK